MNLFLPHQLPDNDQNTNPKKVYNLRLATRQDCLPTRFNSVRRGITIESRPLSCLFIWRGSMYATSSSVVMAQLVLRRHMHMVWLNPMTGHRCQRLQSGFFRFHSPLISKLCWEGVVLRILVV
ncbi:hypothetical protein Tco_0419094 [Tanacetum coccineum]